jgi:AraC-like DNA-binding protein
VLARQSTLHVSLPPAGRSIIETRDHDHAASLLSTAAVPYQSEPLSTAEKFFTRISLFPGQQSFLSQVSTYARLRIRANLPDDFFAVVLGVRGSLEHQTAGSTIRVSPRHSLVQAPQQTVLVKTPEQYELIFIRMNCLAIIRELENLLDRPLGGPLDFAPEMDMNTLTGVRFRTLVTRLISACSGPVADPSSRISTIAHLERELFSVILQGQRHNYTRLLHRYSSAGPWQMRAVLEYAHSHAHVPLTLGDLAKVAGVSARTLQHNFQRRFGCGPMQVLRSIRMQSVRDALLNRDETAGVSEIAVRWGFLHFGRFAAEYRSSFHESPSDTLRNSRQR